MHPRNNKHVHLCVDASMSNFVYNILFTISIFLCIHTFISDSFKNILLLHCRNSQILVPALGIYENSMAEKK